MKNNAFILTGDAPIPRNTLKRLLLIHDTISFSDISDEAIVNNEEVNEIYPNMTITWAAKGHYPRIEDYADIYDEVFSDASILFRKRILNPILSKEIGNIEPGSHWIAYNAALSNKNMVEATAIDANDLKPNLVIPNTVLGGGGISAGGYKSRFDIKYEPSIRLNNISDEWNVVSHLRVGRGLKSIRIAQAIGASPVAIDEINSNLTLAIIKNNSKLYSQRESIIDFSIESNLIDNQKLEEALEGASWQDILHMRKETLAAIANTKKLLNNKLTKLAHSSINSADEYLKSLETIKKEHDELKEKEIEAWEKLKIGAVISLLGAVGTTKAADIILPIDFSLSQAFSVLVSTGLIATSTMKSELTSLIPIKRKLKENPLFYIEKCKTLPLK
ncbi:hypothetical protein SOV92_13570 [Pectobacterium brasiliense]|uniref:Uncharacterized protein n=1 Tax=Pectobacterium brasiliense TaxID=180957 RepID=A0AAW9H4M4_9GAMM|nr:hypothetical protein [Pectobacterium brasiliense]MDY4378851.1 hypothetical protein [Pectobacterium brasiliense]